jgi:hypothetical protein
MTGIQMVADAAQHIAGKYAYLSYHRVHDEQTACCPYSHWHP